MYFVEKVKTDRKKFKKTLWGSALVFLGSLDTLFVVKDEKIYQTN